ncbi:MAG: lysophospholipid acyltransferase family protein [Spirochaetales bacterium]
MDYYLSRNPRHTIIGGLRGLFRIYYFTAVFILGSTVALFLRATLSIRTYRRIRPALARKLGKVLVYASNIRVRHHGKRPHEGSIIVANHLSWADAFTFLGELGCRFMANHLYGEIVGFGAVLKSVGVAFMNRMSVKAIGPARRMLRRIVRSGESILFFPEGRTSRGADVRRFRSALLQVAVDLGLAVEPASISYRTPAGWPPASVVIGWEEWPPLITHIYRAFHAPRIICDISYGGTPLGAVDRQTLAAQLHERVSGLFLPMPQLSHQALRQIDVRKRLATKLVYDQEQ